MNKSMELYSDEYFDWWADFLLKNSGEIYSLQSCDAAISVAMTITDRDKIIKLRDAIIKKVQKSLN